MLSMIFPPYRKRPGKLTSYLGSEGLRTFIIRTNGQIGPVDNGVHPVDF